MESNNDATIIYYSSCTEDPEFERKIQESLVKNSGGLPIVSVTQKPMDLGTNIVVGNVGQSGFNVLRQSLIACETATTKYIITAEADCLYSPDYFQFRPLRDDICYRNTNTYLVGYHRDYFWKKNEGGVWSQVINREFYIKRLKELLDGELMWDAQKKNFPKEKGLKFFDEFEYFETQYPCISFKSGKGMRKYSHSERVPIYELPYWGDSKKLIKSYYE